MANEVVQTVLGQNVKSYKKDPDPKPYTKVVLTVDENTVYTVGDDTGITLEAECPWGSQAMANALLRQINGWVYRPFDAEGALLNPAIEIGDGAVINEDELGIFKRNTTYSNLAMADISSPSDEEIDHEYPWVSAQQRETDRKFVVVNDTIQANYSEFKTTASEISASVTAVETNKLDHTSSTQTMSWNLTSDGFYINNSRTADTSNFKFKVDADGAEVNGTIRATAGEIGSFYIGASDLHTRIKDGNEYVERTDHNSATRGIRINSSGISMGDGTERTFYVTNAGRLIAKNAEIEGTVRATSGYFGSLTVTNKDGSTFTSGNYYGGLQGCGGYISSGIGVGRADYSIGTYVGDIAAETVTADLISARLATVSSFQFHGSTVTKGVVTVLNNATTVKTDSTGLRVYIGSSIAADGQGHWISCQAGGSGQKVLTGASLGKAPGTGSNTTTLNYLAYE